MKHMTGELPKVSIVLPTYNGEKRILESIRSCLAQSHRNIELIVVDDGSTDATADVVRSCASGRLMLVSHHENLGLPSALNTGFRLASGSYLTWTSDDNQYTRTAIATMLEAVVRRNLHFAYSDYMVFDVSTPSFRRMVRLPKTPNLCRDNSIGPCFLYSRKVADRIGEYDQDTVLAEDYDYWIRVSREFEMIHVGRPLYLCGRHSESLTTRLSRSYAAQVACLLVRLKNKCLTIDDCADEFIHMVAVKNVQMQSNGGVTRIADLYRRVAQKVDTESRNSIQPQTALSLNWSPGTRLWTSLYSCVNFVLTLSQAGKIVKEENLLRRRALSCARRILQSHDEGAMGLIGAREMLVDLANRTR